MIEILKHPTTQDWILCRKCALVTMWKDSDKEPSEEWKVKILKANHSPIRTLEFCFRITDIPYWVSVHLCRHIHAVPFVSSQRNDRQNMYERGKAPQDAPVSMCWYMNAEELITIAHKRLCRRASPETRKLMEEICSKVIEVNPEFKEVLVPNCVFRGGICDEFKSCGFNKTMDGGNVSALKETAE
jgi:thymidylate synthase ThyX